MTARENLPLVIVGHVDHGKSTLIGRILADTKSVPQEKIDHVQAICKKQGKIFEYAFLLDALQEEQEQGITIDTTRILFSTVKRDYTIIDAPGHKEFLKNMVSGASSAQAAILILDVVEGMREQSKRHAYILSLLGIKNVFVVVNKMDMVEYSQEKFDALVQECSAFLSILNIHPLQYIPISALQGDTVVNRSDSLSWYTGPTVVEAIDGFSSRQSADDAPLRFPIQDIYKFDDRRIIAGRIESGSIAVGDSLYIAPKGQRTVVKSIEVWNADTQKSAHVGQSVGITVADELFIERGNIICHEDAIPVTTSVFNANIFWLGRSALVKGKTYILKVGTQKVLCEISSINKVIDASTLDKRADKSAVNSHDVAEITITTKEPVVLDSFSDIVPTGRFVIVDNLDISGGGIITAPSIMENRDVEGAAQNLAPTASFVSREDRLERLGSKQPKVIWMSGLPGCGKNTIARALERKLFDRGHMTYLLTGSNLRFGLSSDLDFSSAARKEQTRRAAEVAKLFYDAGITVVVALVSPYREDREYARSLIKDGDFVEVFLDCPIEVCRQRNPRGVYDQLEKDPEYEQSDAPEFILKTAEESPEESLNRLFNSL